MPESAQPTALSGRAHEPAAGRWWRILSRFGIEVRSSETRIVSALHLYCFLLGAFQFASKSVRQSTFVDSLGFGQLPYVYLLVAICAYPVLRAYGRATVGASFHRVVTASTFLVAGSLVLFWWLLGFPHASIRFVFYIWISIVTVMMVSQFWTFANQALDPRQARRLFAYILSGGLLGGVLGGQIARFSSNLLDTRATLLIGGLLVLGTAATIPSIQAHIVQQSRSTDSLAGFAGSDSRSALRLIRLSPHLRSIAVLMFLTIVTAQIIDLQFNWVIEQRTGSLDERTVLFGNLYSLMGVAAFLFQLLVTSHVHRKLGIGVALRVLPLLVTTAVIAILFVAQFAAGALIFAISSMKISENAVRYSLDQGTRELLFVPVIHEIRARVKAYIDVLVQRFAKGAAAILLLTVTFGWIEPITTNWFALAILAIWIVQAGVARRHYVAAFREGLLSKEIDPAEGLDVADVKTLEALVEALGSDDGVRVLHSLELLDLQKRGHIVPPLLLRHDDPDVRLATLRILVARSHPTHLIEELLTDPSPRVRAEAVPALTLLSGTDAPKLSLSLLRDSDIHVRGSAVASLLRQDDPELRERANTALRDMLTDANPKTRMEAARALGIARQEGASSHLLQLLYDSDIEVAREAIASIRNLLNHGADSVLFAPILVSLLRERRLKHEAREALVAIGESILPILSHFMLDPNEQPWVRRALPKTIARLRSTAAQEALTRSLTTTDLLLKKKIIQALGSLREELPKQRFDRDLIHNQILGQTRLYLQALSRLAALSQERDFDLEGIRMHWQCDQPPSLLQQLLMNRMHDHMENLFGLLILVYKQREVRTSEEQLRSDQPALRGHTLEYLDNTLHPSIRPHVLAVLDDVAIEKRLTEACRLFDIEPQNKTETLESLILQVPEGDAMAEWIAVAALETIRREGVEALYPLVQETARTDRMLLQETAIWALRGLEIA